MNKRILICLIFLISLSLFSCKAKSDNEGAQTYENGKCVAFYPSGSEKIEAYVKELCSQGLERIYDYRMEEAGDFYVVSYYDGKKFYIDEDHKDVELKINGGEKMLSDLLRYRMRKEGYDLAYTSGFWVDSAEDALDLSHISLVIGEDELKLHFDDFDYDMKLPFGYARMLTGKSLGVLDRTSYEAERYIDPNRPMVAITYDDGPYRPVDLKLYEIFDRYGGLATFYSVGSRMSKDELDNIAQGIELGMEFGSHTEYHTSLSKQDAEEGWWAIMETVEYVEEKLGYRMKTYRPPYGNRNPDVEEIIGMPAILWTVDSKDWSNRDEDITYDRIMNYVEDGDVVLMHSLYKSSARATERLVPELIDRGFQLVTVSELLYYKGIDMDDLAAYGSN